MIRRGLLVICLAAVLAGTLAPLATAATPTVLTVFTNGAVEYLESTRDFFREFERRNPDLKIDIQTGELDKFLVLYASGQIPDLLRLYGSNVPEYAARGLIQPLEPFLSKSQQVNKQLFFPVLVENSLSYKNQLYSMSWGLAVTSLFVNRDRYDAAGLTVPDASWSWEVQGIGAARKLTQDLDGDGRMDRYFMNYAGGGTNGYAFLYMSGANLFDSSFSYQADSPEGVKGLQFLYDLMAVHNAMPAPGTPGGPWDIPSGKTASHMDGSWYVTTMLRQKVPFAWTIGLMPSLNGRRGTSIWPETPWAIPTGAKNPALSWRLMEYIGSRAGQEHVTRLGLAMPPLRVDVARSTFVEAYPNLNTDNIVRMALAELTRTIPTAPTAARQALDQALNAAMAAREPPQQALQKARSAAEAAIKEFREKLAVR